MKNKRRGAAGLLLAILLLSGCAGEGKERPPAPPTAPAVVTPASVPGQTATHAPISETALTHLPTPSPAPVPVQTPEPIPTEAPPAASDQLPAEPEPVEASYILNKNTKKFHVPTCSSVDQMKESNKRYYTGDRDELIAEGWSPCKRCCP